MLSIPATKAFEVGSGFRGTEVPGSKHNDMFVKKEGGGLATRTNWSGGIQGGITNGQDIYFRYVMLSNSRTELEIRKGELIFLFGWGWSRIQDRVQVPSNHLPTSEDCAV